MDILGFSYFYIFTFRLSFYPDARSSSPPNTGDFQLSGPEEKEGNSARVLMKLEL